MTAMTSVREHKLFGRLNPSVGQELLTRCMTKAYNMGGKVKRLKVKSHKASAPPPLKIAPLLSLSSFLASPPHSSLNALTCSTFLGPRGHESPILFHHKLIPTHI